MRARLVHSILLLLLTSLLLPIVPPASATLTEMGHAGEVAELEESALGWWNLDNGNVLYASESGKVTEYSVTNNVYTEVWTYDINKTLYGASSINDNGEIAFGTAERAHIISVDYGDELYNISAGGQKVVGLSWDSDNDLWITGASDKMATEWTVQTPTSAQTTTHSQQITDVVALDDGKIVTSGRDKNIRVHDDAGIVLNVVSITNGELLSLEVSDDGQHLFSITHNCILYVHNTTTWNLTTSYSICSGGQAISVVQIDGRLLVGTTNGKVQVIDIEDFSKEQLFDIAGVVIDFRSGDSEGIYALTRFSITSEVHLIDIDTDNDGTVDSLDWRPNDPTQWIDSDGDGYGDNESGTEGDEFKTDPSQWVDADNDGIGDNYTYVLDGNLRINEIGDAFPNNPDQSKDRDGDGYGDNIYATGGDSFPEDPEQWNDSDYDGYGDNPAPNNNYDDCPNQGGQSSEDRFGCLDSDYDGWSDPNGVDPHPIGDADPFPQKSSQWRDSDGDGYGDNLTGFQGDSCPAVWGNSTRSAVFNATRGSYDHVNQFGCVDDDGDGYSDVSESRTDECKMKDIKTEWIDHDRDCVGSNTDYNDTNPNIATLEDFCQINPNSTECVVGYDPSQSIDNQSDDSKEDKKSTMESVEEFAIYGGIIAVVIILALLLFVGLKKSVGNLQESRNKRKPDAQYTHQDATRELDAWESGESFETRGGIDEQKEWEGEPLADSEEQDSMDDLMEGIEEESVAPTEDVDPANEDLADTPPSTDEVADVDTISEVDSETSATPTTTESTPAASPETPPAEAPPLPSGGLPEGWTTEQWRWYGHQWLERHGQK